MTRRLRLSIGWFVWSGMLVLATAAMIACRSESDQSTAVLTLLLVVLGGSIAGGRALGFSLACAGFVSIDYYFQPPYNLLSINKPLDGVVLVAFLAVATATTDLLVRTREQRDAARERASEVASLSKLGAATLRYAAPDDALLAIARLVRDNIGAVACAIVPLDDAQLLPSNLNAYDESATIVTSAIEADAVTRSCATDRAMGVLPNGHDSVLTPIDLLTEAQLPLSARFLALPLRAEDRMIGLLLVRGKPVFSLAAPRRRFLTALTYYASLAVERRRLVAEASHLEALREANRAKDQFLASISHDLRTPLTTIKVLAQHAQSRGEPSAPAIVEQADRMSRMVADVLELSRLRSGSHTMHVEINTAEDVLGAALRRSEGVVGDRLLVPHIDLESPALVGRFDFAHTLRILGNLLDNAIRYTAPGGVVDLSVDRDDRWLCFTIADRGVGVPAAERERIFDFFYRPADALPDAGHSGLGLSIARTLAERQGGTLDFSPREGGGSTFVLRLPAVDAEEEQYAELDDA